MVGLDDLNGLFQPKGFHDSMNNREPGHPETMERFFLGFMFGQGNTKFSSSSEEFSVSSPELRDRGSGSSAPSQGPWPFPCL